MLLQKSSTIYVCLFLNILAVSSDNGISLTFVIDDTRSMYDKIDQVKKELNSIISAVDVKTSDVREYVLVTFNDPVVKLRARTTSPWVFRKSVEEIYVHNENNFECSKMALSGVIKALEGSRPRSYVYVFTDASAKDYDKVEEVKSLCQKKQIQVVFILSGVCNDPKSRKVSVYHEIAAASSGQVFMVDQNDFTHALQMVKEKLRGKMTTLSWRSLPPSVTAMSIPFKVDEKSNYVIVSTAGDNVELEVIIANPLSSHTESERIMWTDNGKVLKLVDPEIGTYLVNVKADSATTVAVYAVTDFSFDYGFLGVQPKSIKDVSKQPLVGKLQYLAINVTDVEDAVDVQYVQILGMSENVIKDNMPLTRTDEGFYVTNRFIPPAHMFKIAVKGEMKSNRQSITRISNTAVEPQQLVIPSGLAPKVKISQGTTLNVNIGASTFLTCKVLAYPKPIIKWKLAGGQNLPMPLVVEVSRPLYISYLELNNVKKNVTYSCFASNKFGVTSAQIEVSVGSVLKPTTTLPATTVAEYGKQLIINCAFDSSVPLSIKWYKSDKELLNDSVYTITNGGSQLIIKSVEQSLQGNYTCVVATTSGPQEHKTMSTNVEIKSKSPVIVKPLNNVIEIQENGTLTIDCRISEGEPKPQVQWFNKKGLYFFKLNGEDKEQLTIHNVSRNAAGKYNCTAENFKGKDVSAFDVIVYYPPSVRVIESVTNVLYGSTVVLSCLVESNPASTIVWTRDGIVLSDKVEQPFASGVYVNELKLENVQNSAEFKCVAANSLGTFEEVVKMTVKPAFEVLEHPDAITMATAGRDLKVNCLIKSISPISMKWYRSGVELSNSTSFTIANDRSQLIIKSVEPSLQGNYTCEASLILDPSRKETFSTNVQVASKSPVIVKPRNNVIEVQESETLTIDCKISEGEPLPQLQWFNKRGLYYFKLNGEDKEQMTIHNVSRKMAGKYNCTAENFKGKDTSSFDVIVNYPPNVRVAEYETNVLYGSTVVLSCLVESNPAPTIVWTKDRSILSNKVEHYDGKNAHFFNKLVITNVQESAEYICDARNSLGSNKVSVNITVHPAFEVSYPNASTKSEFGKRLTVNCTIKSRVPIAIRWYKAGEELFNSKFFTISSDGTQLIINALDANLQGDYLCEAAWVSDSRVKTAFSTNVELIGKSPVIAKPINGQISVEENGSLSLECKIAEGIPKPTVKWIRFIGKYHFKIPNETNELLTIRNVSRKDGGVIKCIAENFVGNDTFIFDVKVHYKPKVNIIESERQFPYGSKILFTCEAESNPPATIEWLDGDRLIQVDELNATVKYSVLRLEEIQKSSEYTCVGRNSLGSDKVTVTAIVHPEHSGEIPVIIKPENNVIEIQENQTLTLDCKLAQGTPKPQIRWSRKLKSYYYKLNVTSEQLIKPNVTSKDAGLYKCMAENLEGKDFSEFEVKVNHLPKVKILAKETEILFGSTAELICDVVSNSETKIVWKDNKDVILVSEISQNMNKFSSKIRVVVKKAASFICTATNGLGTTSDVVILNVRSPFAETGPSNDTYGIMYRDTEKISCNIETLSPARIKWYFQLNDDNTTEIHSSDKYTLLSNNKELQINSMELDQVGKYICEVSLLSDENEKKTAIVNVNIAGLIGPEVIYSTSTINDRHYTAICRVKGVPNPIISWQFKPLNAVGFHTIPGAGEELHIEETTAKDSGIYKCVAKNPVAEVERTMNLIVEEAPAITNARLIYLGVLGDNILRVPCNVTGYPEPQTVWKQEDKVIVKDSKYDVQGNDLLIRNPNLQDSTKVVCEASNKLGTAKTTFDILVTDSFENDENYYGKSSEIFVLWGQRTTIKCKIDESVSHPVRWYLNGQITNQTGSEYVIDNASVGHDGNYTCRVNTDQGPKYETYVLDVGYPPTFQMAYLESDDTDWLGDITHLLICPVDAKPFPKTEWLLNGDTKVSSEPEFAITGWGVFTCIVSNIHGKVNRTFTVTTNGCLIDKTITKNMPVMSHESIPAWPYFEPNEDFFVIEQDTQIKLSCINDKSNTNAFKIFTDKQEIIASCIKEDKFDVDGKIYKFSDLKCLNPVESTVIDTREQCLNSGFETIQVGFNVNGFLETYRVCYDKNNNVPAYTMTHMSTTNNIKKFDGSTFKWIQTAGVGDGKASEGYNCTGSSKCCYDKGQLTNAVDVISGPAQAATFRDHLNSVAVWKPCEHSGRTSWEQLEKLLRTSITESVSWTAWTGASNYELKNGGPVPRYLWKVLAFDVEAIAMVYVNDPSPTFDDIRCTKECYSLVETDQYFYCCDLDEFSNKFGIPLITFKSA